MNLDYSRRMGSKYACPFCLCAKAHGTIDNDYYMFTMGFNEPKPRSYTMDKIEEEYIDKVFRDNNITESMSINMY